MVRANICPSIYQRTDAQTFLELGGGEGREQADPARFLQPFTHDDDNDDEPDPPPTVRPSFSKPCGKWTRTYLLSPFPAPTPLSNNKISTIFARDHRIETRARV